MRRWRGRHGGRPRRALHHVVRPAPEPGSGRRAARRLAGDELMGLLFTSESVTEGHPDKICDAISDAILDELLAKDPRSRVAVETLITTGQVHVAGEVTTEAYADIPAIVRDVILEVGYARSGAGSHRTWTAWALLPARRGCWSTRPAGSSSVGRWGTPA